MEILDKFALLNFIATGWTVGVRFPRVARYLSLLYSFQTGSGTKTASYPMGSGVKPPGE
jgi:hypothetical protein